MYDHVTLSFIGAFFGMSSSEVKTVEGAYARIEGHEELCAERYHNIRGDIQDLKSDGHSQQRVLWGILIALLGWMALQLWNNQQTRFDKLEHPTPPAATSNQTVVLKDARR